jgi:hypothetical protein
MPLFTLGLSRDTNASAASDESYLAFGGLPPVDYDDSTWGRTPILSMSEVPGWGITTDVRGLYIISADAYVYGKLNASSPDPYGSLNVNTTQFPILIDCGSSLTRLPTGELYSTPARGVRFKGKIKLTSLPSSRNSDLQVLLHPAPVSPERRSVVRAV